MNLAIILTGTVKTFVNGGHYTTEDRYRMYTSTLEYYANVIGKQYPIYFVENSDFDLSPWNEMFKDRLNLTVCQFSPGSNDYDGFDNTKGKGYNEYLMIKKCILTLNNTSHQPITHFLKITGRYSMLNITDIIHEIQQRADGKNILFMGDIKDTCIYELLGIKTLSSHWGDSRFFMSEYDFYRNTIIDCYQDMNDYESDKWAEHYFLRMSRIYRNDRRFIFRFRTQVRFDGVSGALSTCIRYDSTGNRIKASIRQICRYLFPNIWF